MDATEKKPQHGDDESVAWAAEFAGASRSELALEFAEHNSRYLEALSKQFEYEFSVGNYATVGYGSTYSFSDWDTRLINNVRMPTQEGGPILKSTLNEADFPELYVLKRKTEWLEAQLDINTTR